MFFPTTILTNYFSISVYCSAGANNSEKRTVRSEQWEANSEKRTVRSENSFQRQISNEEDSMLTERGKRKQNGKGMKNSVAVWRKDSVSKQVRTYWFLYQSFSPDSILSLHSLICTWPNWRLKSDPNFNSESPPFVP